MTNLLINLKNYLPNPLLWLFAGLGGLSWSAYFSYFVMLSHHQFNPIPFQATMVGAGLLVGFTIILAVLLHRVVLFNQNEALGTIARQLVLMVLLGLLILPGLIIPVYPLVVSWSGALNLTILGWLSVPLTGMMIKLPTSGYLYLLWFGPTITGLVIISCLLMGLQVSIKPTRLFWFGFVFFICLGSWTSFVYPPTGDEPHYLMIGQSIWHDQDIDLSNQMKEKSYQSFYPAEEIDFHYTNQGSNKLTSKHFPLLSLLASPLVGLAGRFGMLLMIMAAAALIAVLLYYLIKACSFSEAEARTVWLVSIMTVPLGIYFDLIYTELPAISVLLIGLLGLISKPLPRLWLTILAACLLPWFYPKYIPLSLMLGGAVMIKAWQQKKQLVFKLAVVLMSAAAYGWFYHHYFGVTLADNPYGGFHAWWTWRGLGNGLGLLVDRDFGLLSSSPIMLLAAAGLQRIQQKNQWLVGISLAIVLTQFLLYTHFDDFSGSSAISSRHFLPAAIMLLPGVGLMVYHWLHQEGWRRITVLVLLVLTTMTVWLCAAWPMLRYLSPKLKLWQHLGWVPSLFPGLADGMTNIELIWALASLAVMIYLSRQLMVKKRAAST